MNIIINLYICLHSLTLSLTYMWWVVWASCVCPVTSEQGWILAAGRRTYTCHSADWARRRRGRSALSPPHWLRYPVNTIMRWTGFRGSSECPHISHNSEQCLWNMIQIILDHPIVFQISDVILSIPTFCFTVFAKLSGFKWKADMAVIWNFHVLSLDSQIYNHVQPNLKKNERRYLPST